ncbi:hypothetical protein REPUB_Repub03eG0193600 [Reevesia pubescens]
MLSSLKTYIFIPTTTTRVNGVYYWQASGMPQPRLIQYKVLVFDLGTEVFQLIESPISGYGKLLPLHDGRISIWDTETIERSNEIWVLNDEGHWTKLLNIDPLLKVEGMFGFWKNGKVFVESESGQLLLYDLDTKEFKDVGIKATKVGNLGVNTYEESLVAIGRVANKLRVLPWVNIYNSREFNSVCQVLALFKFIQCLQSSAMVLRTCLAC